MLYMWSLETTSEKGATDVFMISVSYGFDNLMYWVFRFQVVARIWKILKALGKWPLLE